MVRRSLIIALFVCGTLCGQTVNVSLSGMVKKTGGTAGLAGVAIGLARLKNITATSNTDGTFSISQIAAVRLPEQHTVSFQFVFNGGALLFFPGSWEAAGQLDIFSCAGKRIASFQLNGPGKGMQRRTLPEMGSGIFILRFTSGGKSLSRTLVKLENGLFLIKEKQRFSSNGSIALANHAPAVAVDTLIAIKSGYLTKRQAIDSYTKQDMVIEMDTAGGKCTREVLQAAVDSYLLALQGGDPSKMSLTTDAKYIENMKASSMGQGIWKTPIKVAFSRSFLDVDSCVTFSEIIDTQDSHRYVLGTRMKILDGKIAVVSALVSDSGDWLFNADDYYKYSKGEDWKIIPVDQRKNRDTVMRAGNAYLDLFAEPYTDTVPWGVPCARLEGGMYTGDSPTSSCNVGVPRQNLKMTSRQYVVDLDMQTVDIFCLFGGGMPDSHLFRLVNGKLRYVHTISIQ